MSEDRQVQWILEEKEIRLLATQMLLVGITVGKVADKSYLVNLLRSVPVV